MGDAMYCLSHVISTIVSLKMKLRVIIGWIQILSVHFEVCYQTFTMDFYMNLDDFYTYQGYYPDLKHQFTMPDVVSQAFNHST